LQPDQAFPALIEKKAATAGLPIKAINAGLSGETSAGALRRIDWALKTPADVIVIETGANDALRGLSVEAARSNIEKIVAKARAAQPNAKIVLVEMLAPPNLGRAYTSSFQTIYTSVAKQEGVTLIPFFLDGVAGRPELNQADGVHPNAAGARLVADNVWRVLKPIVAGLR
jgi:acyl-CoA thioesterase I